MANRKIVADWSEEQMISNISRGLPMVPPVATASASISLNSSTTIASHSTPSAPTQHVTFTGPRVCSQSVPMTGVADHGAFPSVATAVTTNVAATVTSKKRPRLATKEDTQLVPTTSTLSAVDLHSEQTEFSPVDPPVADKGRSKKRPQLAATADTQLIREITCTKGTIPKGFECTSLVGKHCGSCLACSRKPCQRCSLCKDQSKVLCAFQCCCLNDSGTVALYAECLSNMLQLERGPFLPGMRVCLASSGAMEVSICLHCNNLVLASQFVGLDQPLIWGTIYGKTRGRDFVWKVKVDGGSRFDIGEKVKAQNTLTPSHLCCMNLTFCALNCRNCVMNSSMLSKRSITGCWCCWAR
jgi:hypothetical protein